MLIKSKPDARRMIILVILDVWYQYVKTDSIYLRQQMDFAAIFITQDKEKSCL